MGSAKPRLFLLDTFGLIFRAYHGRARTAVSGMRTSGGIPTEAAYVFHNSLQRMLKDYDPTHVIAVWEGAGPTFREREFPEYKANRDEFPEDLRTQLPYIKRLLGALNIAIVSEDGYEADDTIALLAHQAVESGIAVCVVSMDKDLMQVVGDKVSLLDDRKRVEYDASGVERRLGVKPEHVTDFLALMGDPVDNIPGAPGIGKIGARKLIAKYGTVEKIIDHAVEVRRKSYRESLLNHADQIRLSKRLATLDTSGKVTLDLRTAKRGPLDRDALLECYRELEFVSLANKLRPTPAASKAATVRELTSADQIREWLASSAGPLAVAVRSVQRSGSDSAGIEVGLSASKDTAVRVPPMLAEECRELFEAGEREVWVHDCKAAIQALAEEGISLRRAADDTMLMAFLADSSRTDYSLPKAVRRRLGTAPPEGAGDAAAATRALRDSLHGEMDRLELRTVYEDIELPLAPVLASMEATGIQIDPAALSNLSARLADGIEKLQSEVFDLAGREFKIGSPKQLGEVLYQELGLPTPQKRGKSKAPSTASDVLERLKTKHPIPGLVLEWRKRTKLKNTYVDALPAMADADNRLHTTFDQTGSATGRLSSKSPNLQNLPTRTALGREIRCAFVAAPGSAFVSADYSQVELRVLAHLSRDSTLVEAFKNGDDLHRRTASEVLGIPPSAVGPDERSRAKAVNFGIIYGLSAFGLARQLQIPQRAAKDYIARYFARYTGVKEFTESVVERTRKTGYSETLFGRRRPVPNLNSRNHTARSFAQRIAVNSPIQGSAADLIKAAMLATSAALTTARLRSKIVLQIHDSLLVEAPSEEVSTVSELLRNEMESVAELAVPLVVDVKAGPNMRDLSPV